MLLAAAPPETPTSPIVFLVPGIAERHARIHWIGALELLGKAGAGVDFCREVSALRLAKPFFDTYMKGIKTWLKLLA